MNQFLLWFEHKSKTTVWTCAEFSLKYIPLQCYEIPQHTHINIYITSPAAKCPAQLNWAVKHPLSDSNRQLQSHQSALLSAAIACVCVCVCVCLCVCVCACGGRRGIDFANVLWSAMRAELQLQRSLSLDLIKLPDTSASLKSLYRPELQHNSITTAVSCCCSSTHTGVERTRCEAE